MKWIPVGRVVSTHGTRGEVKFRYYNEVQEDFLGYTSLFVGKDEVKTEIRPARVKFRQDSVYIQFHGLNNLDEVSFLVNKELYVRETDLADLKEDEYYEYQLIGLNVTNLNKETIGRVESVLHTGASDVLVVAGKEKELMVPLIEGYVTDIDMKNGTICVDEKALSL
ncbi:MAG TPA: ribosome maturation factor RimM [Syntrophorhabdaceae bacterium]|nr:ribosome maturation factor RimM [Syntrophorhabdaceae bacterium]